MSFMSNECGGTLSISQKFRQSAQELKSVRTLTGVSMLLAMSIVISFVGSVRLTETLKIGLGYLITALLGMLYGPFTAAIAAGAGDIIKYLLKPDGAYFFGFTLTAMLGGMVYGFLVPGKMHHLSCDCIQELNFVAAQLLLEHLLDFPFVWNAVFGCIGSKGD